MVDGMKVCKADFETTQLVPVVTAGNSVKRVHVLGGHAGSAAHDMHVLCYDKDPDSGQKLLSSYGQNSTHACCTNHPADPTHNPPPPHPLAHLCALRLRLGGRLDHRDAHQPQQTLAVVVVLLRHLRQVGVGVAVGSGSQVVKVCTRSSRELHPRS